MPKTRQVNIRFDDWMYDAIKKTAKEKGLSYSDVVKMLIGIELEYMGFSKARYDAEKYEIGKGKVENHTKNSRFPV